ncbi:Fanconi-associated nuclease [Pleurostoma richardsiae]|uniref:Fanconi-associated nuclease n=1 Tax=Pleurostoma richardsiae TaxID=41990 RepID=A0AA38R802_9PEZI|nr:Fanconi-associated nuclease [Pleurostoma richardsiae]
MRPAKRPKLEDASGSEGEASPHRFVREHEHKLVRGRLDAVAPESADEDEEAEDLSFHLDGTAIESALPQVSTDDDAIQEYETMRASQRSTADGEGESTRTEPRKWVKGKSSIYVDAFNLALDTVLEDESHLFDKKEMAVFQEWRGLDYEAQYLYVRLFLRKTAAWHRIDRLGYYDDVSDPDAAITSLQETRRLPQPAGASTEIDEEGAEMAAQDWSLGETFTFADSSDEYITSVEEAAPLLSLDELKALAKEARVQGKNKADIVKRLCKMSSQQAGLLSLGLRRESTAGSIDSQAQENEGIETPEPFVTEDSNRKQHFLKKILAITGSCIRISPTVFKLFERVHLVFYRSTEWTEKSLTTIILAKISRRNFPQYVVDRTTNIFPSRRSLLEFEQAMRTEYQVDQILEFNGSPGEAGFRRVLEIFETIAARWRGLLEEEQRKEEQVYEYGEGCYLRRFNAAHAYTRVAHKAAFVLGRLKVYQQEHALLSELLDQRLFQMARRGSWYQRKALVEEHYMFEADPNPRYQDPELQKKHWRRIAVQTCQTALEDRDCHLIYHYDLQKRLTKLERLLKIPKRLQHDFGHVRLQAPEEHTVTGIQIKRDDPTAVGKLGRGPSTKTIWVDEAEGGGECSVEAMCLSDYRSQGWKGYHSEGGIVRTIFAYLFFDILFLYIPNVFQTAYQTCPLDLHTDAFYPARASEINHRLVEIANGSAERLIRGVDASERERRTCVVGLNWDFDVDDLVELAAGFGGEGLAAVCRVMAQEYGQRGGGIPDLVLWRTEPQPDCMFVEVKSATDRLSDTQRLWIHVLTGAGVKVALCNAVAREVRTVD